VRAAGEVLDRLRPDVVCGFGGYVCVPAYLAARRRRLPLVGARGQRPAGITNRLGARLTSHVAVSFPGTPLRHATFTGLPVRAMVSRLDRPALRAQARAELGLAPHLPTLLVFGGSQGARRLNQSVGESASALVEAGVQVLHASGAAQQVSLPPDVPRDMPRGMPAAVPYVVVPYIDRMDLAYAAADLVVCRAGANTVTEVACVGLPAVFVPLPHGNGEQARNAAPVVDAGGGLLVADDDLTPQWVRDTLPGLLHDRERLAAMSSAAADLVPRDADVRLAEMVLRVAAAPGWG
jgi:UDP-N-acetylglucosamine--N-acetylmuramyl-(pentapeptide) pyrophosphoryl-undecaprenol N-acetylglucosamine transferase